MFRTRNLSRTLPSRRLSSRTPHAISLNCFLVRSRLLGASAPADSRSCRRDDDDVDEDAPRTAAISACHCLSSTCPHMLLALPLPSARSSSSSSSPTLSLTSASRRFLPRLRRPACSELSSVFRSVLKPLPALGSSERLRPASAEMSSAWHVSGPSLRWRSLSDVWRILGPLWSARN